LNELLESRAEKKVPILTPITAALIVGLSDVEMSQYAMRRNCLSLDCLQPSFCASHHLFIQDSVAYIRTGCFIIQAASALAATSNAQDPTFCAHSQKQAQPEKVMGGVLDRCAIERRSEILKCTGTSMLMQPAKHMTGILMCAEMQDSHGNPVVLVIPDISVYDPAMSDNIISVGHLMEDGYTVIH